MQQNGRGFGSVASGLVGIFSGTMLSIDPMTGALTQPASVECGLTAESLKACGTNLYMASRESGSPRGQNLYTVDRTTGAATLRGAIGTTPVDIDALACVGDRLYGVDADPAIGRTLFEIEQATGRAMKLELPPARSTDSTPRPISDRHRRRDISVRPGPTELPR